jgi:hypothetical protein
MIYPGIIVFAIGLFNLLCIPMPWGKKGKLKKFSVQMISAGSEQPLDRWKDAAPAPPPLAATAFHPESERIPMEDDLGVLEPVEEIGALEEEEELDELEPIDDPVPVKAAPVVKQAPAPMRKVAPGVDRVPAAARVVAAGGPAVVVKRAVPLPKPVVGGPGAGKAVPRAVVQRVVSPGKEMPGTEMPASEMENGDDQPIRVERDSGASAPTIVVNKPRQIAVRCQCGKSSMVDRKFAGKKGKCKTCGTAITVPAV